MVLEERRNPVSAIMLAAIMLSGCAARNPRHPPDTPVPAVAQSPAPQPNPSPSPAAQPPSPISSAEDKSASGTGALVRRQAPATPARSTARGVASDPRTPKHAPPSGVVKSTAPATPSGPSLDLSSLEQRLKDTHAIGVFTKLSLKNQVDDLLTQFRTFHQRSSKTPPADLRQQYDSLMAKVLSLLQNGDPQLASAIAASREAIWGILVDPEKFAKI